VAFRHINPSSNREGRVDDGLNTRFREGKKKHYEEKIGERQLSVHLHGKTTLWLSKHEPTSAICATISCADLEKKKGIEETEGARKWKLAGKSTS